MPAPLGREKAQRCPGWSGVSGGGSSVGLGPPTRRMSARLGFQGGAFLDQAPGEPGHTGHSLGRSNWREVSADTG